MTWEWPSGHVCSASPNDASRQPDSETTPSLDPQPEFRGFTEEDCVFDISAYHTMLITIGLLSAEVKKIEATFTRLCGVAASHTVTLESFRNEGSWTVPEALEDDTASLNLAVSLKHEYDIVDDVDAELTNLQRPDIYVYIKNPAKVELSDDDTYLDNETSELQETYEDAHIFLDDETPELQGASNGTHQFRDRKTSQSPEARGGVHTYLYNETSELQKDTHKPKQGERNTKSYHCDTWGKIFTRKGALAPHIRKHLKQKNEEIQVWKEQGQSIKQLYGCSVPLVRLNLPGEDKSLLEDRKTHTREKLYQHSVSDYKPGKKQHVPKFFQCAICNRTFSWKRSLVLHIRKHITQNREKPSENTSLDRWPEQNYHCSVPFLRLSLAPSSEYGNSNIDERISGHSACDFKTEHTQHMKKLHQCNICKEIFTQKNSLIHHINKRIKKGPMESSRLAELNCSAKKLHDRSAPLNVSSAPLLEMSSLGYGNPYAGEKLYECSVCEFRTEQEQHFSAHMRAHTGVNLKVCSVYLDRIPLAAQEKPLNGREKTYSDKKFHQHNLSKSKKQKRCFVPQSVQIDKTFECSVCGHAFARKRFLTNHFEAAHRHKLYKSSICQYKEVRKTFSNHLSERTSEKPLNCSICKYSTAVKANLQKHVKRHAGEKPFGCSVCPFKTGSNSRLKVHMALHTGIKPHECLLCGFKTAYEESLKIHWAAHTGEKPHKCSVCGFKTAYPSSLRKHKILHTGKKPYACSECVYRTAYSTDYKRHMKIHTGEKPYECLVCGFKTAFRENLYAHTKLHTGENLFECSVCGFKTHQKRYLKVHITSHTPKTHTNNGL